MIQLKEFTPEVYYDQSRDFQFIGRLFDLILNSVKTNTELIYALPLSDNSDEQLLELLALTLGFKSKHDYGNQQLRALCNVLPLVLKNKGSFTALNYAINALLSAEGVTKQSDLSYDETTHTLTAYVPVSLSNTNLLRDLLDYILPAGISCNIYQSTLIEAPAAATEVATSDAYAAAEQLPLAISTLITKKSSNAARIGVDLLPESSTSAFGPIGVFTEGRVLGPADFTLNFVEFI